MNSRWLITGLLATVGLTALWAVGVQRKELLRLRSEQQQFLARLDIASPISPGDKHSAKPNSPDDNAAISELLRLRAEVTRLAAQKRGLAGVLVQAENLRTNPPAATATGNALPPGYLRRSQARFVGYASPEDTMQSLLWAVQNKDWTNFLAGFSSAMARNMQAQFQNSGGAVDEFFRGPGAFVGMRVVERKQPRAGMITLQVEFVPGMPTETITFQQVAGQWRIIGM